MSTILTKKSDQEIAMARSDDHYDQLASDPEINEFKKGTTYNSMMINQMPVIQQVQPVLEGSDNAAQNAQVLVKNKNENWINTKWRPAMGWSYMAICVCDFILFPILFTIVQFWEVEAANDAFRQWVPITLQGAGLIHLSFGAILGITAFGRSKEKIEGKD